MCISKPNSPSPIHSSYEHEFRLCIIHAFSSSTSASVFSHTCGPQVVGFLKNVFPPLFCPSPFPPLWVPPLSLLYQMISEAASIFPPPVYSSSPPTILPSGCSFYMQCTYRRSYMYLLMVLDKLEEKVHLWHGGFNSVYFCRPRQVLSNSCLMVGVHPTYILPLPH